MPLPTPATYKEPGPMAALPGTGGPTFFRVLNITGWQASWTPDESAQAYLVAKAAVNPALVLDLPPWEGEGQDEALAKAAAAFGKARSGKRAPRWLSAFHARARVCVLHAHARAASGVRAPRRACAAAWAAARRCCAGPCAHARRARARLFASFAHANATHNAHFRLRK
jgi:hypothetical protein